MTITCTTQNGNLYGFINNKFYQVVLRNAKNLDLGFLKKDGIEVDIDTTLEKIEYKNGRAYITLNDNDVAESWYGEW